MNRRSSSVRSLHGQRLMQVDVGLLLLVFFEGFVIPSSQFPGSACRSTHSVPSRVDIVDACFIPAGGVPANKSLHHVIDDAQRTERT